MLLTDGHPGWGAADFTRTQERGTFMHELGHRLGLHHGGDTEQKYRPLPEHHGLRLPEDRPAAEQRA